ncbi:hypothetical protein BJ875DRAFT_467755 [Amylocarpus encephaloides]|uniref:leucine--tRNA ligase n=1 Tax=Amylocarpus encephaloides TaxID=45428 RepID=A0A9P8C4K3_9HELO|nr:hypothetical protein BJ875DRAFT_467755 [Amylocarpus encephaloides]
MLSIGRHTGWRLLQLRPGCLFLCDLHPHKTLHHNHSRAPKTCHISRRFASGNHHSTSSGRRDGGPNPTHGSANEKSTLNLPQLDVKWRARWKQTGRNTNYYYEPTKFHILVRLSHKAVGGMEQVFVSKEATLPERLVENMYILPMFPYPSGDLHLGHLRVYTISDVLARFRRMQGYRVMHPIGWDAFGLPAENAAIERGIDPATWTKQNIQKMKGQLDAMNGHWDWDREFATCDPTFYKHTQRLFLLLYERGLAYQAEALVNYDPVDKTVLANEQVDSNGKSWRSGAKVEKRMLKQWFFKISEFREELLGDLRLLSKNDAWPERVLAMQKNWIGKSKGAKIKFPVTAFNQQALAEIEVFTTRPDTLFGVQYLALGSTHTIVQELAKSDVELQAFLDTMPALPQDSKIGYLLPHVRATNPMAYEDDVPDATKTSLPIYVAPYVVGDYGDGAVMGVPGHDTRDHAFWKHNRYDEPIRTVISSSPDESTIVEDQPFVHPGHLTSRSGRYAGKTTAEATKKIVELLASKNLGGPADSWRLRDWLVSRQRYWGTPIPIIHCKSCGPVPVPKDQLPVELPPLQDHWVTGKAGNPLEGAHEWINTSCPKCGEAAKRDTDTMDTFVDSSWYFMRYPDARNPDIHFSADAAKQWLPVDIYVGGVEHAILHLLYARFISKFLALTPYWPSGFATGGEPFKTLLAQGMVHGKTYSDPSTGRFLKPTEVSFSKSKPVIIASGKTPDVSFEKMSKSKYNGVDPTACMNKYGADATRAHILFQAPVSEVLEWDEEKIAGVTRWMRRLHNWVYEGYRADDASCFWHGYWFDCRYYLSQSELDLRIIDTPNFASLPKESQHNLLLQRSDLRLQGELWRHVQKTIRNVTASYSNGHSLNTVVSDLMSLTNAIIEFPSPQSNNISGRLLVLHQAMLTLLRLTAPIAPAFSEECWSIMAYCKPPLFDRLKGIISTRSIAPLAPSCLPTSIFENSFPEEDGSYESLAPATQKVSVQVNGKLKCVVEIDKPLAHLEGILLEKWVSKEILSNGEAKGKLINERLDVRNSTKVIVVKKGQLVNFVIGQRQAKKK